MCVLETAKRCLAESSTEEDASGQPNQSLHFHLGSPWGYTGASEGQQAPPRGCTHDFSRSFHLRQEQTQKRLTSHRAAAQKAHSFMSYLLCHTFPGKSSIWQTSPAW